MERPTRIQLRRKSKTLELTYGDSVFSLGAELLRVHSPSAEVQGHGPGQAQLQFGKRLVGIEKLVPAGNYGLRIHFDDGHDSGIYSWSYLYKLGANQDHLMADYEKALFQAGLSRDPDTQVLRL